MASMIEIPLGNAFLYIRSKVKMRNTYESGPVPELATHITGVEQDFVQLSSLDVVIKSCTPRFTQFRCVHAVIPLCADLVMSLLSLQITYRAWRSADKAVWLKAGVLLSELHAQLQAGAGEVHQHVNLPRPMLRQTGASDVGLLFL